MDKLLAQLSQHEVFNNLSETELASLGPIIHTQSYEEGATVFDIGQQPNFLFYISKGRLRLHLTNNEHKTLLAGQLFGEVGVINADFRSGTVMAVEPTDVICICGKRLFQTEFVHPEVALKIVRALSRRITNYLRSKENMSKQSSELGLGTAAIGRPQYINIRQDALKDFSLANFRKAGHNVLERAYQKGIRYFDTAPGYGLAEQLVLDWVEEKKDPTIEVATKWGYTYVANFDAKATVHEVKEHSLAKLNEQWIVSKKLLPYLKIYQIHSATFETGILTNQAVLNRLAALKATHNLHIGITTTGENQVAVIQKALEVVVNGVALFDAFQVTYNMLDQSLAQISQQLLKANKKIIIKEALANGRIFPNEKYPHYRALYKTLDSLAKKYKVGTDAIALRFCMDSITPFKVLSGAANEQHIIENLKIDQFQLTEVELARLQQFAVTPKVYWQERKALTWN